MRFQSRLKWISVFLLFAAVACRVAYEIIGVEIDAQGFMQEPFALIPLGWICLFGSVLAGVSCAVCWLYNRMFRKPL